MFLLGCKLVFGKFKYLDGLLRFKGEIYDDISEELVSWICYIKVK